MTTSSDATAAALVADRLCALADTADLMGDEAGGERLRAQAAQIRLDAMARLDEHDGPRATSHDGR